MFDQVIFRFGQSYDQERHITCNQFQFQFSVQYQVTAAIALICGVFLILT